MRWTAAMCIDVGVSEPQSLHAAMDLSWKSRRRLRRPQERTGPNGEGAQVVNEDGRRYVYAVLQSSTKSREDIDDLEFLFKGKVVCYRSVSRVFIPDPPFCWWAGCINGPRNRGRLERLRDDLGWMPLETDEDKHWVPLLLH